LISAGTYKELQAHKADLSTFKEAAQAVNHRVLMLIEVKPGVNPAPIVKAAKNLRKNGWDPAELVLGSRSYGQLQALHDALPDTELFVIDRWSGIRATWRARRLGAKRLHMNYHWLWSGFIRSLSRRGWELYAYPLNDPFKASRWAKHGLAGVITDYPDRYKYVRE
jgi:glycerophosphoryl diester phosphodiesterase